MKSLICTMLGILLYLGSSSHAFAQAASSQSKEPVVQDTITIQIGSDKKVIILVKNQQALKSLQQYDLNKMVRDLNAKADSSSSNKTIIITDEEGTRYRVIVAAEEQVKVESDTTSEKKNSFEFTFGSKDKDKKKDSKREYRRTSKSLNFDLGMNNYLENGKFPQEGDAQYAVRPWGSWYVGIHQDFKTQVAGPLALQWGVGINWYNFKFEDPSTRLNKQDGMAVFSQDIATETHSEKSKLTASYINLMAVPMLDFGYSKKVVTRDDGTTEVRRSHTDNAFRIGLGGYAGYRLGSYTKYKFEVNNDDKKDRDRGSYYLNNWRYGARLQLGFKGIDLFAQYDLNELFTENRGPQLNAFSFGITL